MGALALRITHKQELKPNILSGFRKEGGMLSFGNNNSVIFLFFTLLGCYIESKR